MRSLLTLAALCAMAGAAGAQAPMPTFQSLAPPRGAVIVLPGSEGLPPAAAPGVVASTDEAEVCGYVDGLSYSKRHRLTTPEMKDAVRRRDGMVRCGEIDHRLPLALGGADDMGNLWCQSGPEVTAWNYHIKDRAEVFFWHRVCREHAMLLAEAQAIFLAPDWRDGYCRYIGGEPCP